MLHLKKKKIRELCLCLNRDGQDYSHYPLVPVASSSPTFHLDPKKMTRPKDVRAYVFMFLSLLEKSHFRECSPLFPLAQRTFAILEATLPGYRQTFSSPRWLHFTETWRVFFSSGFSSSSVKQTYVNFEIGLKIHV